MKTVCIINIRFKVYGVRRFDIINRLFSTQPLKFTCTETDIQDFLWLVRALFSSVHQRPGGRGWGGGVSVYNDAEFLHDCKQLNSSSSLIIVHLYLQSNNVPMVQHPHMTHLHPLLSYSPEAFSPQRASPGFSPDTGTQRSIDLPLSMDICLFVDVLWPTESHLCCSNIQEPSRRLLPRLSRRNGSDHTSSWMVVSKTHILVM